MLGQIGFGVVAVMLLFTAFRVVTARNLVHTVLWLGLALAVTAVVYVMLGAHFLAAIQIILYTGGVLTLMLFGVMLTHRDEGFVAVQNPSGRYVAGGLLAVSVFAMLAAAIVRTPSLPATPAPPVSTEALGAAFLTEQVLAFEVLSLLLLVAAVGAIVMARRRDAGEEGESQGAVLPERKVLPLRQPQPDAESAPVAARASGGDA
ncbi:MAG: NADH-quinone oxidoreductase subunit J [Myxococcales bacterium]|nr:NADH-quinone oxidoreductase subunit J [Myxococcales bacterium]